MAEQLQEKQFTQDLRPQLSLVALPESTTGAKETEGDDTGQGQSRIFRPFHLLSRLVSQVSYMMPAAVRPRRNQGEQGGGIRMIFRRENRGESFQRQINDLRQQPSDAPADEEEQVYQSDEMTDTSRFATEHEAEPEGISYPAARAEPAEAPEAVPEAPAGAPPAQAYSATSRWQAPASDATTSTIAANSHWNGTLKSEGSLRVHGKADGELHSTTDLYVAEGAEVDAELHADSVVVAGLVRGRIEARSRLEVLPQGVVSGDVHAPKLVVHEGATLSGQLKMQSGASQPTYSRQSNTAQS